jgi:hypothetical protein
MLMDLVPIMVPILPQEGLVSFGDQEINSVLNSISRQQFARKFTIPLLFVLVSNVSEKLCGPQTNQRAEVVVS